MSDQTQEEVVEETPVEPAAEPTPETPVEAAPPAEGEAAAAPAEGEAPPAEEQPYEPDFSYKVYGEKKELPDFVRPLINSKEAEEYFREHHQKAEAYDILKEKHEAVRGEHTQYQESIQKEIGPILEATQMMKRSAEIGDYEGFFKAAGVKPENIFQWAVEKAQYQEMTPEQRNQYDSRIATLRENSQLKYENEQTTTQMQDIMVQQRERELNLTLDDPAVNQVMQEFDARRGKVGAFRDEVVAYANGQWYAKKQDISPREAVEGVFGLMGRSLTQEPAGMTNTQTNSATSVVQPRTPKPTIPSMKSGHASPVKRAPRTLDEMRQLADQMQE